MVTTVTRGRKKPKRECFVDACSGVAVSKSFCTKHYYRFKKHGDPLVTKPRARKECIVNNCLRLSDALGYCKLHRDHLKRHGDPTKYIYRPTAEERFLSSFEIADNDECWLWHRTIDSHGYGILSIKHKYYRAHRFSYEYFVGEIPVGLVIDHECHNTVETAVYIEDA